MVTATQDLSALIPRHPLENLEYRSYIFNRCLDDADYRWKQMCNCAADPVYWINTFCFIYEPRVAQNLPFITFPFQDELIRWCEKHLGIRDMTVVKSRDMGASWVFLSLFMHRWLFDRNCSLGLVSAKEDLVDATDDDDCLMWKLDFHLKNLPTWMIPNHTRIKLLMRNHERNNVIRGYPATGNVARGGRKTAMLLDELHSWNNTEGRAAWNATFRTTQSRIALSTPQGNTGIFYDIWHSSTVEIEKMELHWTQHPWYNRGLYWYEKSKLIRPDKNFRYPPPEKYGYVRDNKPRKYKQRSLWYDRECERNPSPQGIAQELDCDWGGAGNPFFEMAIIHGHTEKYACEPRHRGNLFVEDETWEPEFFPDQLDGRLSLWCELRADRKLGVNEDHIIGCDIATGRQGPESTASVASVVNNLTGRKVAEYVRDDLPPQVFAEHVAALRKFFKGPIGLPTLIFEKNGPGEIFRERIWDIQPERIWRRKSSDDSIDIKESLKIGWDTRRTNKPNLLANYQKMLARKDFINPCREALQECIHYVHTRNGVEHDRSMVTDDMAAANANHGDRVIADSLAAYVMRDVPRYEPDHGPGLQDVPYGSPAYRHRLAAELKRREEDDLPGWDLESEYELSGWL